MIATSFTYAPDLEALVLLGGISGIVAAFLTIVWLAMMVTLPTAPKGSGPDEELAFIAAHDRAQIARFLPTTLVAFAYVPTWQGVGVLLWDEAPAAAAVTVAFGLLYATTTASGYWLQYTVVRGLADLADSDPASARAAYAIVGFHDRPTSMTATAVILGYTMWSLGAVTAGIALAGHGGGLAVTTGVLLLVTAALMFIGVVGHIARNRLLGLGVFLSGVMSLAATIATALLLITQA